MWNSNVHYWNRIDEYCWNFQSSRPRNITYRTSFEKTRLKLTQIDCKKLTENIGMYVYVFITEIHYTCCLSWYNAMLDYSIAVNNERVFNIKWFGIESTCRNSSLKFYLCSWKSIHVPYFHRILDLFDTGHTRKWIILGIKWYWYSVYTYLHYTIKPTDFMNKYIVFLSHLFLFCTLRNHSSSFHKDNGR